MESRSTRQDLEGLLAHAGWLQELAASLVRDPGTADDVVQDTWLAALVHAPEDDRPLEPWLARVARNFAFRRRRDKARRAEHEGAAGLRPEAPTPDQTVERLDLQRSVVEALLTVDEPFRTVIVQRYFEGQSAAEIARAHGVPAGTVRWRLSRGLAELRVKLDGRFGSRESWSALLMPLAIRPAPASAAPSVTASKVLTGVLAMSAMQAAVVGAAMIVVAGVVWWSLDGRGSAPTEATGSAASQMPANVVPALERAAKEIESESAPEPRVARAAVEPSVEPASGVALTVAARTASVDARFVDASGAPLSGVRLAPYGPSSPWKASADPTLSEADGRARLEVALPVRRSERSGDASPLALIASRGGSTSVARTVVVRLGETTHLGDVVLVPGVRLFGRVVDELGRTVANATVGTTAAELPPEDDGRLQRQGSGAFDPMLATRISEDGSFVLDGVGAGTWRLWGHADGTRYAWSAPIEVTAERDLLGLELVLPALLPGDRIEGRIVDPEGNPVHAGLMCLVHDERRGDSGMGIQVDPEGRFAVVVEHEEELWDFTAMDLAGRFSTISVTGVRPGTLDVLIRMRAARLVNLRVRDDAGRAVERARFVVSMGGTGNELTAQGSAPGDYRAPVPDVRFELKVSAPGFRTRTLEGLDPAALPDPLDVVLQRAPLVRGRVTADGHPLEHALVELRRDDPGAQDTVCGFRCVMWSMTNTKGPSDASGRFELTDDFDGPFWIRVTAEGFAPGEIGPIDVGAVSDVGSGAADFDVVLTHGGAIEGRVLLPEGDGEGTIVAINHGDGAPRTTRTGPQGVFRFEGLAPGPWQVLPNDVELDPAAKSYSSTDDADPIEWSCEVFAGRTTHFDLDLRPK